MSFACQYRPHRSPAEIHTATGEQDADATGSKLTEHGADSLRVLFGHRLFVFAIGRRQCCRQLTVREGEDVLQKVQVRLILIVRLAGLVQIRNEKAKASGAVEVPWGSCQRSLPVNGRSYHGSDKPAKARTGHPDSPQHCRSLMSGPRDHR